ncbi:MULTISPECIES: serine hydrolase [Nocardia]|uniref:serine hydrolase n=1 Tax=Nocardia TaxID=1817 RepID=UPI00245683DF|nr:MULTISPECIES: serine hydrolase [Nocardia]
MRGASLKIGDVIAAHGLRSTTYPTDATMPAPDSRGYAHFDEAPTDVTARTTLALAGAAGTMVSTISDLADYARMLGRGDLLKPETFRARTQFTGDLRYGQGVVEFGRWIGHNGAVPGYATHMGYLPELDVSVTVAVNEFTSPPLLGLTASMIWFGIVRQLSPGTVPEDRVNSQPSPPSPAVADLDNRLRRTLDPAVSVAEKPLRIADDDKDHSDIPGLRASHHDGRPSDRGRPRSAARDRRSRQPGRPRPGHRLVRRARRSWYIATGWACRTILTTGEPSPACP